MDDRYQVRPANRADLPTIVALERAIFSDPWSPTAFRDLWDGLFFVAASEDRVLGYVIGRRTADEGEILNLAVDEQFRGRGVGRALLDTAIGNLRDNGVSTVYLEVRESNQPAQDFYRGFGFSEVGRRRNYYDRPREDARILALKISRA